MIFKVQNLTRGTCLARRCALAATPVARMRGLLGRAGLAADEGLIIAPCQSIHMFFMRFAIDAIFVDRQSVVVGLVENILPNRVSPIFWRAVRVIELPSGTIRSSNTMPGDKIDTQTFS